MNLKQYLTVLTLGTAVALSAWFIVILALDPVDAGMFAFVAFYVTMISGMAGLLTIIGTIARARKYAEDHIGLAVARSLRQAVLLTVLVSGCLALLAKGLFSISTALVIVALVAFVEFLFLNIRKSEKV